MSQAIAKSAHDLFRTQGYDETTVDQIAARAGVSPRTFFNYFPTKAAAFYGDDGGYRASLAQLLEDFSADGASLGSVVEAVVAWSAKIPLEERERFHDLLYIAATSEGLREETSRATSETVTLFARIITPDHASVRQATLSRAAAASLVYSAQAVLNTWARSEDVDLAAHMSEVLISVAGAFEQLLIEEPSPLSV